MGSLEVRKVRRSRDELAGIRRESRDGLAVFFEGNEEGPIRTVGLLEVPDCFLKALQAVSDRVSACLQAHYRMHVPVEADRFP